MLRYFGAKNVRVLDGGFKKWKADKKFTRNGPQGYFSDIAPEFSFSIPDPEAVITDVEQMQRFSFYISKGHADGQILDARSAPRFHSEVDEPRAGLRRGNIPGSKNSPFNLMVNENGTLKSEREISMILLEKDIDTT